MKRYIKTLGVALTTGLLIVGCASDKKAPANNDELVDSVETSEDSTPKRSIPKSGDEAPELSITGIDEKDEKTVGDFKGKKTLINFFSTTCGPCREEMPDLNKLYENHGEEVNMIAVATGESEAVLNQFKEEFKLSIPIYMDDPEYKTSYAYFVRFVPMTYLIDENGVIENIVPGMMNYEMMEDLIGGK